MRVRTLDRLKTSHRWQTPARAALRSRSLLTALAIGACAMGVTAAPNADAESRITTRARQGETRPWMYIGHVETKGAPTSAPEARARAIVTALGESHVAQVDLVATDTTRFGDGDAIVHFEQTYRGLPVIGRGAAVRMNAHGEHVLSTMRVETALSLPSTPTVPASDAAKTAQGYTPVRVEAKDAHLVVFPVRGEMHLAWAVTPRVLPGLPTAPRIMIDANDGRVLESRDLVVFADQASVYETNPTTSPKLTMRPLAMATDGSGHLQNDFVVSQNCIDKKAVKSLDLGIGIPLSVHVCDLAQLATHDANGDFVYTPIDDPADPNTRKDEFSEVSMYHHVTKVYSFFRTLQGDPTAQITVDKPLRTFSNLQLPHGILQGNFQAAADPNTALDTFQNAFFSPAGAGLGQIFEQIYGFNAGAMWFGQGPRRDYSYDGDVVYHEFTHAVVDKTLKLGAWHLDAYGMFDAPGAMNEGLADYFSSALAGDPNVGEYASKDIDPTVAVIRTLDNTDTCPGSVIGEVHWDSTVFSGGLWKARATLAEGDRGKFDAALYKAMLTHAGDGDVGYEDVVNLFLESLKTDLPAGATALTTEMTKRGILPGCTRVFDGKKAVVAPTGLFSPGAFAAPGTQNVQGAKVVPGMLQVTIAVPEGATKVTVQFTSPPAQTGGIAGFGGGGTPFTPVVLSTFDGPIQWTTTGALTSNATSTAAKASASDANSYSAVIPVKAGAKSVFVQIGNSGTSDGSYTDLRVTSDAPVVDAGAPTSPDLGADAGGGTSDTPPSGGGSGDGTSSGCGCSVPSKDSSHTGRYAAAFALAGIALFGARRRRTSSS